MGQADSSRKEGLIRTNINSEAEPGGENIARGAAWRRRPFLSGAGGVMYALQVTREVDQDPSGSYIANGSIQDTKWTDMSRMWIQKKMFKITKSFLDP